jgi:chromate reductase, NAD(P)H dehydrogenase (quinone)
VHVVAVSGSLKDTSANSALLRAMADLDPEQIDVWPGLATLPHFTPDDDGGAPVASLRAAIAGADAVLIATPEYNSSVPGQLKNALDWVSRPIASNALRFKPVAVVGASTGVFGAVWSQAELRKILAAIGARVVEGEVALGHAPEHFDDEGRLVGDEPREQLAEVVSGLVEAALPRIAVAA